MKQNLLVDTKNSDEESLTTEEISPNIEGGDSLSYDQAVQLGLAPTED